MGRRHRVDDVILAKRLQNPNSINLQRPHRVSSSFHFGNLSSASFVAEAARMRTLVP